MSTVGDFPSYTASRHSSVKRKTLTLWMVRREEELLILERKGNLRTDGRRIPAYRRAPYSWMSEQLAKQVAPPYGCLYPLWAWVQYAGSSRCRPDLRTSGYYPSGTKAILLELELSHEVILPSDFQKWHAVLNRCYLANTERQHSAFEAGLRRAGVPYRWPYPEPFASRVITSWQRVFDFSGRDAAYWGPLKERQIQCVFWELRIKDLRSVTHFRVR